VEVSDPHSSAALPQGRIKHLELHCKVRFHLRALNILAHYNLEKPAACILFLDSRDLDT
jgi:hypothetical protein